MIISFDKPPVYDDLKKAFQFDKGTVFAYGNVLYNPDRMDIPDHLMVHEMVHGEQQQHDEHVAAAWYKRYIADPAFRIDQECEAYAAQYAFICSKVKDKNARFRNLHIISQLLSGPMYGNAISYTDAMRRVRNIK